MFHITVLAKGYKILELKPDILENSHACDTVIILHSVEHLAFSIKA